MAATFPAPFPSAAINFITFNQDHSCIAVGTSKGYRIFNTDPFNRVFSTEEVIPEQERHVSIIEMLFSTSLVALVLNPRHLVIQNTKVCLCLLRPNPSFPPHPLFLLHAPPGD